MTPEEQKLYNQMIKLGKKANMRILRLERETGIKEPFGVKRLYDYLSSKKLNIITKSGRIGTRKDLSLEEIKAINKQIRSFLSEDSISTVRQARNYKAQMEKERGTKLKWTYLNSEYQAVKESEGIVEHLDSDFWVLSRYAKEENWTIDKWVDEIKTYIDSSYIDEANKEELQKLYDYAIGVKG